MLLVFYNVLIAKINDRDLEYNLMVYNMHTESLLSQHSIPASLLLSNALFDMFSHLLNILRRPRPNYSSWLTW